MVRKCYVCGCHTSREDGNLFPSAKVIQFTDADGSVKAVEDVCVSHARLHKLWKQHLIYSGLRVYRIN